MDRWELRTRLVRFIKSWPYLLTFILLSSLIGWGTSRFWKPDPRASTDLYVGVDTARVIDISSLAVYAKTEPLNMDDYKNWQLSQFEAVAESEEVAGRTLERLRENSPRWEDLSIKEFQKMGSLAWFDAGRWRLTIQASDPAAAREGVIQWRESLQDKLTELLASAELAYRTEGKLRALEEEIVGLELRNLEIQNLQQAAQELSSQAAGLPETGPSAEFRRTALIRVRDLAGSGTGWEQLLVEFPESGAETAEYQEWLDRVQLTADTELQHNLNLLESLESSSEDLLQVHIQHVRDARGFSPAFYVEAQDSGVKMTTAYPDGLILLISGLIGIILYSMFWIMVDETGEVQDA